MKDTELPKLLKKDPEYQENLSRIRDANMDELMKIVEEKHNILIPSDMKEYYRESDKEKKDIIRANRLVKVLKPKREDRKIS